MGAILFHIDPGFQERIHSLANMDYYSNSQRLELWSANWQMFINHPLLGLGIHKNYYQTQDYHKILNHKYNIVGGHAHNTYLQLLTNGGLLVFLSLIAFFVFVIKNSLKDLKSHSKDNIILRAAFLSVFIGFLVSGLFDYTFGPFEPRYMFLGILSTLFFLSKTQDKSFLL